MTLVRARFDAARTQIFSQDSVKQLFNTQAVFLPLYPLCVSGQKRPLVETPHSFEINKTVLAQLNTEFKKTFKLHCCLVGGDQKEPKKAVVTLPFPGGEWNAESVYNSIVWKSFEEANEACNEVRVCHLVLCCLDPLSTIYDSLFASQEQLAKDAVAKEEAHKKKKFHGVSLIMKQAVTSICLLPGCSSCPARRLHCPLFRTAVLPLRSNRKRSTITKQAAVPVLSKPTHLFDRCQELPSLLSSSRFWLLLC